MTDESTPQPTPAIPRTPQPGAADTAQRVRAQLASLADLDDLPPAEHVERYGAVHTQLQAALRDLDRGAG